MSKPMKMELRTWIDSTEGGWRWNLRSWTRVASSEHRAARPYETKARARRAAYRFARNNGIEIEE